MEKCAGVSNSMIFFFKNLQVNGYCLREVSVREGGGQSDAKDVSYTQISI